MIVYRHIAPPLDLLTSRLSVDVDSGRVFWIDATKHHIRLNGKEAGCARKSSSSGKHYWHIKLNGVAVKRSAIVFCAAHGRWPVMQIDHINGDSLDDRAVNLREATPTQNAWNHKLRTKKSPLPMGVRAIGGRFQARIAKDKTAHSLGCFDSAEDASRAYRLARTSLFGEFA